MGLIIIIGSGFYVRVTDNINGLAERRKAKVTQNSTRTDDSDTSRTCAQMYTLIILY